MACNGDDKTTHNGGVRRGRGAVLFMPAGYHSSVLRRPISRNGRHRTTGAGRQLSGWIIKSER